LIILIDDQMQTTSGPELSNLPGMSHAPLAGK